MKFLSEDHEIIPSRCRARNRCRGFYFDPVTFDTTETSTKTVLTVAESPEKDDVGGVDEVSCGCCFCNKADSRVSRFIDC